MSLTGQFYLRNNQGKILIDPATGLPIRNANFVDGGYDRQPDWTMGLTNTFRYHRLSLDFLLDFRHGGDVLNATQHYLVTKGLDPSTLDRETPRVVEGVLRDGKENSANPTVEHHPGDSGDSDDVLHEHERGALHREEHQLGAPARCHAPLRASEWRYLHARSASVFVTGTDLFLMTNYTGLDPIVNANTAGTLGSGGVGIDFGNFPVPKGVNFGLSLKY